MRLMSALLSTTVVGLVPAVSAELCQVSDGSFDFVCIPLDRDTMFEAALTISQGHRRGRNRWSYTGRSTPRGFARLLCTGNRSWA
jgi:hypothetical protein